MCRFLKGSFVTLAALLVGQTASAQLPAAPSQAQVTPVQIVLVEAAAVTPAAVSQWGQERFKPGRQAFKGFMLPMHSKKRKAAFHEPPGRAGCPQPAGRGTVRTPRPTTWRGFMVPMH